jgi:class 3 adenylate cyclase
VLTCPNCGQESPDTFRFCPACAAPLGDEPTASREERKVVTVLFADLVGFTSRSEQLDPEDVRAVLAAYHGRLRTELERHGGTVEKFIGDAVMAVFGAPVAHEDDPERAVRAALAIREWVAEGQEGLHVRIGINTGETIVDLSARPAEGEGMVAGDVVNTAARLQSAAPVDGILVGEQAYEATRRAIEYGDVEHVEAKGKTEPVAAWPVVGARSRFGVDVSQESQTPLVGRDGDLRLLVDALDRVRRERSPQLVTLVGVPGIGKSRLAYELFRHVDQETELTTWRQGRCLPYGEGVSFWALGEVVKAQAGILETDDADEAGGKLRDAVAAASTGDADWVESHLRPLVGLVPERTLEGDRRSEAFAAWRQFLEALAAERPLVLVIEDLQWADDSLLDFVDHLVDWARDVPLLVVATARPELLTRRPGWGGGKANAATISLSSLTDEETAQLVHALLETAVLPAEAQAAVLNRAEGNPLYAEEFARLLRERGGLEKTALPESVQGIIAARLDLLGPESKALVQAASVLGKVFWLGAVAAISGWERWSLEQELHDLERREFVRRERRSSMEGETEYAFRHLLVRDVAYGQIPRGERAERHRAAASWIESLGRADDHAEMRAHHYVRALDLLRAAGRDHAEVADAARGALRAAGDRSRVLNAYATAADQYAQAVALWPVEDADRPSLLLAYGSVLQVLGDERADAVLSEAHDELVAHGDPDRAALACSELSTFWWDRGQRGRADELNQRALERVSGRPASAEKVAVLNRAGTRALLAAELDAAVSFGGEALTMADELGLDDERIKALSTLGAARANLGDDQGMNDLAQAFELALARNSPEAARLCNNLGYYALLAGDVHRNNELRAESLRLATRFGVGRIVLFQRGVRIEGEYLAGLWDDCVRHGDEFIAECEAGSTHYLESLARTRRAGVRFARGDAVGADEDAAVALQLVREIKDPQLFQNVLAFNVQLAVELGRLDGARALADELLPTIGAGANLFALVALVWVADDLGVEEEVRERLRTLEPASSLWLKASREILDHEFEQAAETFAEIGCVPDEAEARLRSGRRLQAEGRADEAERQLERARAFYREVNATRLLARAEQPLADSA